MQILGIGVDIVSNLRIKKSIKKNSFINRVFSKSEIYQSKKTKNKSNYFSKRFAANEAFMKALGTGFRYNVNFKDISVINNKEGKPELKVTSNIKKLLINKLKVKKFTPYLLIGIFLWYFTHESGIHSTISGVVLALTIPHRVQGKDFSLLLKLEHILSPYVAFGIMPLFALANAGVSLHGVSLNTLMEPVPLGILCGLFFGKQIGVFLFSYVSVKLKFAEMPANSNWIKFYGIGILTGIGFTMSLFVGNLAFIENLDHMDGVKIGVLCGSFLSAIIGYFLLLIVSDKKQ